ncbi:unnamed protein product [Vitrella brassicaformis CCMP3155]|uniref:Uncharacterized protein n=1 Tax=Vitrella brassicaformis (strain CCMP3155) TaxID=1169540 RepID=A0A0G4EBJ3_VITBC|nr:unnamed protein product [Vitrella brassicaformis CCMP3155]|eukprot:CEL92893.1 unnamed protein product [Vitrella brassicaformis CCMP3155]
MVDLCLGDLQNYAEEVKVTVLPNFRASTVNLSSGHVGPFRENTEMEVPLWLAREMHKARKVVHINPPAWLNKVTLQAMVEYERTKPDFCRLPEDVYEVGFTFVKEMSKYLEHPKDIRRLIEELLELRLKKMFDGLQAMDQEVKSVHMNGLTPIEAHMIGDIMSGVMDIHAAIEAWFAHRVPPKTSTQSGGQSTANRTFGGLGSASAGASASGASGSGRSR